MRRGLVAMGTMIGAAALAPPASAQTIEKRVQVGPLGKALSVRAEAQPNIRGSSDTRAGKARIAMLIGTGDQFGLGVSRSRKATARSLSAVIGLWGDARSVEFGAFQDRGATGTAQTVRQATGRRMETRGVRLTGALYGAADDTARGWTVEVDARHQRMPDPAEALRGARGTDADSRVLVSGKLRF